MNETKLEDKSQKELDIEYHRHAAAQYDADVTSHFDCYHKHSLHPWIRRLTQRIPEPSVLDIGTGTGVVGCTLARFGCRVQAIDHSPEMLAIAAERARANGVSSRVNFKLGDGEKLPYADAEFDAVTIQGVLHHLPDNANLLREALRVLRGSGELYISEPCIEGAALGQLVNSFTRQIGQLVCPRRTIEPKVSDHEEPISGPALVSEMQAMGLKTQVEYLVNVGCIRFLPNPLRILLVLLLSLPTRRTNGDLIFLIATKPAVHA